MEKKDNSSVILEVGDRQESFSIEHAERLLNMENNGGWKLPAKSDFELKDNGIRLKANPKESTTAGQNSDNK